MHRHGWDWLAGLVHGAGMVGLKEGFWGWRRPCVERGDFEEGCSYTFTIVNDDFFYIGLCLDGVGKLSGGARDGETCRPEPASLAPTGEDSGTDTTITQRISTVYHYHILPLTHNIPN